MNILLIGGSGNFINKLIVKLKKERHKVFLVTGERYKNDFYEKVYERFDFPYDGESMSEIADSVKADVTIFMGAQDTNFDWSETQQEAVRYSASLMNVLMSYAMVGKGRFLYLSGADFYKGHYEEAVTEETSAHGGDFYQTTMMQAEELCRSYRENYGLDIVVLRLDRLWSVPVKRSDINNICAEMCLQAMESGEIVYQKNRTASWLYDADAVEYIYRVVSAHKCEKDLYQITSGEPLPEQQVAQWVKEAFDTNDVSVTLTAQDQAESVCVLSNQRYNSEFGANFFCNAQQIVKQTAEHMRKNEDVFLHEEDQKLSIWKRIMKKGGWLIKAIVPFVENLICFIPFFMLNNRAVGSEFFSRLDFYLLYVLLFAVVHGQQQAVVSSLLATCGYIFRQMYTRTGFQVLLDYNTYVWVAQLFIVGMVVGYLRDKYDTLNSEGKEERAYLSRKISDMEDINGSNVRVKDSLETQVINQTNSIGMIYDITSTLDQYMPEEVLFRAAGILQTLMKSKEVAIYTIGKGDYARLYTATSENARRMGNSVRIGDMSEMYETLLEGKVYINRSLNENYPMMASAVFDQNQIKMILMVWNLPWESVTLSNANILAVATSLIQSSVLRAERYLEALEEKRYSKQFGILEPEAFEGLVQIYEEAQREGLTQYAMLCLDSSTEEAVGGVVRVLRQSDYVGFRADGKVYALLANTNAKEANIVVSRLLAKGCSVQLVEGLPI